MSGITIFWNNASPASGDVAGLGDDEIRSLKSNLQGALDAEHVFPSAGGFAGAHRAGSARISVGTTSQLSSADTSGRLFFNSQTSTLHYVGSEGTAFIGGHRVPSLMSSVHVISNTSIMGMSMVSFTLGSFPSGPIATGLAYNGNFYFASVVTSGVGASACYPMVFNAGSNAPSVNVYNTAGTPLSGVTVTVNLLCFGFTPSQ